MEAISKNPHFIIVKCKKGHNTARAVDSNGRLRFKECPACRLAEEKDELTNLTKCVKDLNN